VAGVLGVVPLLRPMAFAVMPLVPLLLELETLVREPGVSPCHW
jgi:hypothetical protein